MQRISWDNHIRQQFDGIDHLARCQSWQCGATGDVWQGPLENRKRRLQPVEKQQLSRRAQFQARTTRDCPICCWHWIWSPLLSILQAFSCVNCGNRREPHSPSVIAFLWHWISTTISLSLKAGGCCWPHSPVHHDRRPNHSHHQAQGCFRTDYPYYTTRCIFNDELIMSVAMAMPSQRDIAAILLYWFKLIWSNSGNLYELTR